MLLGCGGATPAEKAPELASHEDSPPVTTTPKTVPTNVAATDPPEAPKSIPASCATKEGGVCTPDADFASRLCNASYPDVALVLFAKDSPFTRMYLRGDVDGWNADGGLSARAKLKFDEEVLALKRRAPKTTGMVINGGGAGYLVMRWDGTCFTLEDGEITTRHPPVAKASPINWKYLSDRTKDALLSNDKIKKAYDTRGKECKGATSGDVSKACEVADTALSQIIISEIRGGLTVPTPERIP